MPDSVSAGGVFRKPLHRRNLRLEEDRREVIVEQINSFVRENLNKTITISDLAGSLGYSVSYIRAVFRERLGVSLGRYIRESRLSEAAQLLQEPAIKVTDVAERCGFDSLVGFSRAPGNLQLSGMRPIRLSCKAPRPFPQTPSIFLPSPF